MESEIQGSGLCVAQSVNFEPQCAAKWCGPGRRVRRYPRSSGCRHRPSGSSAADCSATTMSRASWQSPALWTRSTAEPPTIRPRAVPGRTPGAQVARPVALLTLGRSFRVRRKTRPTARLPPSRIRSSAMSSLAPVRRPYASYREVNPVDRHLRGRHPRHARLAHPARRHTQLRPARQLVEAVRQADGLVIGSPGYHGGVSGLGRHRLRAGRGSPSGPGSTGPRPRALPSKPLVTRERGHGCHAGRFGVPDQPEAAPGSVRRRTRKDRAHTTEILDQR